MITKSSRAWCVPVFTVFVPGGVAAVSYVSVYIYISCVPMYVYVYIPLANIFFYFNYEIIQTH